MFSIDPARTALQHRDQHESVSAGAGVKDVEYFVKNDTYWATDGRLTSEAGAVEVAWAEREERDGHHVLADPPARVREVIESDPDLEMGWGQSAHAFASLDRDRGLDERNAKLAGGNDVWLAQHPDREERIRARRDADAVHIAMSHELAAVQEARMDEVMDDSAHAFASLDRERGGRRR
jgi:hypothetical protein